MPKILYEDAHLLVCVKPAGVLSQSAEGEQQSDLLKLLSVRCGRPLFLVHRLDRPTGGCLVVAKTAEAAARLSAGFQSHTIEKFYLAVLVGRPTQSEGRLEHDLVYDRIRDKSFVSKQPRSGAKKALLDYYLLAESGTSEGALSLVSVRLHTGRTHQIRAQFSACGLPLWGDSKYGSPLAGQPALWAHHLGFVHPEGKGMIRSKSLPPRSVPWSLFPPLDKEV